MGKRLIQQARGRGGPRYKTPSHRFVSKAIYMDIAEFRKGGMMQVVDFLGDPVRSAPLAKFMTEDFNEAYLIAPIGLHVGDLIEYGESVEVKSGNILPIENIPEGTEIYNIELVPGDGGKLVRASGLSASILSQDVENKRTIVKLPSKNKVGIDFGCRATVGVVAGAGRTEKPFVKAGNKHYDMISRGKLYPRTSGLKMNAQDHPFGGRTHIGRASSVGRNAPPGAKVGNLAPRRTGVRKTRSKETLDG